MLEIDGSYGEGGGQIVRSAIALATVTGTEIKLINIRAGRKKPGLAAQHITAIKAVAKLCNGKYSELKPGTRIFNFTPGKINPVRFSFDIGTAGSITLVFQACLLPAVFGIDEGEIEIKVCGGTDVNWSPPFDYFKLIFLKHLERLGIQTKVTLIKRGYYPKGGGEVIIRVVTRGDYKKLNFTDRGNLINISGIINSRELPSHIPQRILQAASDKLKSYSNVDIQLDEGSHAASPGTGIVLAANHEHTVLGASALGARGIPAERVGTEAAETLKQELSSWGAVDIYAADQLIPYLALLGGVLTVRELSLHTKTNLWLAEQFFDKKFRVEERDNFVGIYH